MQKMQKMQKMAKMAIFDKNGKKWKKGLSIFFIKNYLLLFDTYFYKFKINIFKKFKFGPKKFKMQKMQKMQKSQKTKKISKNCEKLQKLVQKKWKKSPFGEKWDFWKIPLFLHFIPNHLLSNFFTHD